MVDIRAVARFVLLLNVLVFFLQAVLMTIARLEIEQGAPKTNPESPFFFTTMLFFIRAPVPPRIPLQGDLPKPSAFGRAPAP